MIEKKNRDASLERLRVPLLFLGLLFACAIVLTAFEWRTFENETADLGGSITSNELPDEQVFIAVAMKKPLPPPPAPKPIIDDYVKVDNDEKINIDLVVPFLDPDVEPEIQVIATKTELVTEEVIDLPDVWPSFPGGDAALGKFLSSNIEYPNKAKHAGVQGVVWVEFIVGKDGEIEESNIIRSVGAGCDEEALRVISQMPKWNPGKQKGHPVKVRFRLPIKYTLRD